MNLKSWIGWAGFLVFGLLGLSNFAQSPTADKVSESSLWKRFDPFLGSWNASEDALEKWPQLKDRWPFVLVKHAEESVIREYEGKHKLNPHDSYVSGMIYWDPGDEALHSVLVNHTQRFLYRGQFYFDDAGSLIKIYRVHYPRNYQGIPRSHLPGRVRTYREVFKFRDANTLEQTVEMLVNGRWEYWLSPEAFLLYRDEPKQPDKKQ